MLVRTFTESRAEVCTPAGVTVLGLRSILLAGGVRVAEVEDTVILGGPGGSGSSAKATPENSLGWAEAVRMIKAVAMRVAETNGTSLVIDKNARESSWRQGLQLLVTIVLVVCLKAIGSFTCLSLV
jgi:hypothetical protein